LNLLVLGDPFFNAIQIEAVSDVVVVNLWRKNEIKMEYLNKKLMTFQVTEPRNPPAF
jgi:hypothetical protein